MSELFANAAKAGKNIRIYVYADDFLITADTKEACDEGLLALTNILSRSGIRINTNKSST